MAKKKKNIEPKICGSLITAFLHSLLDVGLTAPTEKKDSEISNVAVPDAVSTFLWSQFNDTRKERERRIIPIVNAYGNIFGYALINNNATDKTGCITIACVHPDRSAAAFIIKIIALHLLIEGTGGTVRTIFLDGSNVEADCRSKIGVYNGYKSDMTIVAGLESQNDGVYKGFVIPRHSKIWLIKTCDDYNNTHQLHHRVTDLRSYKEYIKNDDKIMQDIKRENVDPYFKSEWYLNDINPKNNRWSTDYLFGFKYGFDRMFFVLPLTEADFKDKQLMEGIKKLFKSDLTREQVKARFGFYIMNPTENSLIDEPYDRGYDSDGIYILCNETDKILDMIYA